MEELLYTVKQVSKLLQTDEPTVRKLISKGYIRALKLGRLKVRKIEVERFLKEAEGKDFTDIDNVIELTC